MKDEEENNELEKHDKTKMEQNRLTMSELSSVSG